MQSGPDPLELFRRSPWGVLLLRLDTRTIVACNPAFEASLGYPSAALLARTPGEVGLWPDPLEQARVWAQVAGDGTAHDVPLRLKPRRGEPIALRLDSQPVECSGAAHLLCVLRPEQDVADAAARADRFGAPATSESEQSQAMYRVLVDHCRDGVFLVQHGRVLFVNLALAQMLGRELQAMLGMDYLDLVHPDDRAEQRLRRQRREQGSTEAQRYRIRLLHGQGGVRVVEVNAIAVEYQGALASTGVMRDVTEAAQRQDALREAERRYRELFESSPLGLFKSHPDGRILDINPAMVRMLGYDSVEAFRAAGLSILDVYADPRIREGRLARWNQIGQVDEDELQIRTRDGGTCWVNCVIRVVAGENDGIEFAGAVQDISQRRAAEQALQRSEAKYRTLLEHAQVGVFVARGGRLDYVNATLCRMLGRSERELLGSPMDALVSSEQRAACERSWHALETGAQAIEDSEVCMLRADGGRVWLTQSVGRVEIDGHWHLVGSLRDISRQREVERRLRFHATHDPLTGLPNRLDFQQRLNEVIVEARADGRHDYAVLFLDLDGFKLINDSQGHAAGDQLLVSLASRLTDALAGEALVARYGGDEFTVLPFGRCDRARAIRLAENLLRIFETPIAIAADRLFSSASVGIVLGMPGYRDAADVLRDADTAMYRAKAAGKSGWAVFDDAMRTAAQDRFQLEVELRRAIERGEFELHFQPVVSLENGRIVGCEALVRWRHPSRGLLLPGAFLGIAEESGLIVRIDNWVLEEACREARRWRDQLPAAGRVQVGINVNDRLANSAQYVDDVSAALRRHRLEPDSLRLEITETAFRHGRQHAREQLQRFKAVGVQLAVDDFGTGYSSLDSFAAAPFDALKIDRSFVDDIVSNDKHRAIVKTIIGFARDLQLSLVAEGVETLAQQACLRDLGCAQVQGFLYGEALAPEDWLAHLRHALEPLPAP